MCEYGLGANAWETNVKVVVGKRSTGESDSFERARGVKATQPGKKRGDQIHVQAKPVLGTTACCPSFDLLLTSNQTAGESDPKGDMLLSLSFLCLLTRLCGSDNVDTTMEKSLGLDRPLLKATATASDHFLSNTTVAFGKLQKRHCQTQLCLSGSRRRQGGRLTLALFVLSCVSLPHAGITFHALSAWRGRQTMTSSRVIREFSMGSLMFEEFPTLLGIVFDAHHHTRTSLLYPGPWSFFLGNLGSRCQRRRNAGCCLP